MDDTLRTLIRDRAGNTCEYCRLPHALFPTTYQVEHIVALQHRGPTRPDNLAWACVRCNSHKGPNLAGIDPDTGQLTRLFSPRTDHWEDHFAWSGHVLVGRTDIGRTTVVTLAMNDPVYLAVRAALMVEGDFPPSG